MKLQYKYTTFKKQRAQRGFTVFEMLIAAGISSLVLVGILVLQYTCARTVKDLYGPTRARSARLAALNQITFHLGNAKIGTCVVSDEQHRIQFEDPTIGSGITSAFYFNLNTRTLFYDPDIGNSDPEDIVKGPIEITFTLGSTDLDVPNYTTYFGTDTVVTVFVKTAEELSRYNVDQRDGETVVYLRNS